MPSIRSVTRTLAATVLAAASSFALAAPKSLAVLEIQGGLAERDAGYTWLGEGGETLLGLITTIDTLAYDDEFDGLVIRLKDAAIGTTQVEEIGAALQRYRDEGKKVHIFSEVYGPGDLLLSAYADEVILQAGGMVSFPGLHMEEMYLASMLDWIGVKAQLVQVGDYKGANETMTRSEPSQAWDSNISSLLDAMYANMREIMTEQRGLSERELDKAMKIAWAANGMEAIESGLVDAVVDLPVLKDHLSEYYNDEVSWVKEPYAVSDPSMDFSNPFAFLSMMSQQSRVTIDFPTIAVLHIDGTIIDGDSTEGGMFGGGSSTGSRTIRNAIEDIIKEDLIEGVVIRVDSPGGSAMASEVMWQGIQRLRKHKPVWVSVGSMAASGGFYVLSGGERVYVNPSSVVGSIGVVGGKYAIGGVLDKLQVHVVERSRGPVGSLMSTSAPWDQSQVELIRDEMTDTYELFTSRVEAGREGIDLSKTAEGRLFVGSDAIKLKMADEIGGLDDALNDLADELDMVDFDVAHYPEPPTFEEYINEMLGGFISAPEIRINPVETALRAVLGDDRYTQVVDQLNAITLLRNERVLLVSPSALIFR